MLGNAVARHQTLRGIHRVSHLASIGINPNAFPWPSLRNRKRERAEDSVFSESP